MSTPFFSSILRRKLTQEKRGVGLPPLKEKETSVEQQKKTEFRAFLFLVVVLGPALSVAIVGGYGFVVWMSQLLLAPAGA